MSDEREPESVVDPCDVPEYRRFREELRAQAKHALAGRRRRQALRRLMVHAAIGVAAMLVMMLWWPGGSVQAPARPPVQQKETAALQERPRDEASRKNAVPEPPGWSFHSRPLPEHLRGEVSVSTAAPKDVNDALIVRTRPLPESIAIGSRTVRGFVVHSPRARRFELIDFAALPRPAGGGMYALVGYDSSTLQLLLVEPPAGSRAGSLARKPRTR